MELKERLTIQAKNLTSIVYRALGLHPEKGDRVFQPLVDEWPENWIPLTVEEAFVNSGGIEIHERDVDGLEQVFSPGEWVDRERARSLWDTVIPFVIESSRGTELFVLEQRNTMVYVPKCRLMIGTGLSDGSVMKAITSSSGNLIYTKCPVDAKAANECHYPRCLTAMLTHSQPSIKAAKSAYRESVAVALTRNTHNSKMLFLTNGANHLNLVTVEEGIESAWSSGWLINLRNILAHLNMEEPESLEEKLNRFLEEEEARSAEAEKAIQEALVEQAVVDEASELPENITIKEKKPKAKRSKKKAEADLSELDPEPEPE